MKSSRLEPIAYELMGVYALIQAILLVAASGQMYKLREFDRSLGNVYYYLAAGWVSTIVLLIILAEVLIRKGQQIRTTPVEDSVGEPSASLTGVEIQSIAFSVLGVFFCVSAFPALVHFMTSIAAAVINDSQGFSELWKPTIREDAWKRVLRQNWPSLIMQLVEIAIGLWLFFYGPALARFWNRWQARTPLEKEEEQSGN